MNRNWKATGLLVAVALLISGVAWGTSYKNPVEVDWLNFTAELTPAGEVEMHWAPYNNTEDFRFYKVVRSTTNPDPVYPEDGYVKYYGNIDADSYIDTNPPKGTIYYRVCVITKNGDRWVSNVVTIENGGEVVHITATALYREESKAVDVQWTKYTGNDFEKYEVYHANGKDSCYVGGKYVNNQPAVKCADEKDWELIATINDSNLTLYTDAYSFSPGTNFYKVVVKLEGGRSIESNEVPVTIPCEENGGETGNGFTVKFKNLPSGIVDCCNCTLSFSWEANGGSGNYRYMYRLAGYDEDWSNWSSTTSASYQNLPQGSYTFMVICEDTSQNKVTATQSTFTVRCDQNGEGAIPTADISLEEHDLLGRKAVDLKITTKGGTQRNTVDLYFGLVYPTGH